MPILTIFWIFAIPFSSHSGVVASITAIKTYIDKELIDSSITLTSVHGFIVTCGTEFDTFFNLENKNSNSPGCGSFVPPLSVPLPRIITRQ